MTLPPIVHQSSHRLRTRALHGQRRGLPFLATSTSPRPRGTELPERRPPPDSELLTPLVTRPIPEVPRPLATSPHAFLDHLRSPSATPFVIRAAKESARRHTSGVIATSQAEVLLGALRVAGDRLVEVEAGRYDGHRQAIQPLGDNRFEVPLSVYLDWLTGEDGPSQADGGGMQLYYLAQWRARDDVCLFLPPSVLVRCHEAIDLPRWIRVSDTFSFHHRLLLFPVGPRTRGHRAAPSAACTLFTRARTRAGGRVGLVPVEFLRRAYCSGEPAAPRPYDNLYHLLASSEPAVHGKHFLLLPPSLSDGLTARDDILLPRNISRLDFRIRRNPSVGADAASGLEILVDRASAPTQTVIDSNCALSCVLEEGDMLFLPRGWWHRVENVELEGGGRPAEYEYHSGHGRSRGWTAGVGWWFLSRSP